MGPSVAWHASLPAVDIPGKGATPLWVIAVLFFGLGDVVTTSVGLEMVGVVEANPVAAALVERSGVGAIIVQKGAVIGGGYALWVHTPRPYRLGVPLGLALLGVLVTTWNFHVLMAAGLP